MTKVSPFLLAPIGQQRTKLASDWLLAVHCVTGPGKMDVVFMAGLVTKIPLLLPLINYSLHVRQTESQHTLYIKLLGENLVKDNDITIAFGKQYVLRIIPSGNEGMR